MQFWQPLIPTAVIQSGGAPGTVAISGVAGSGSTGNVGVSITVALSGVAGSGAVGTVTPTVAYGAALTGVGGTGAVGNVGVSLAVALSGVAGAGAVGSVAGQSVIALAGVSGAGAVGTLSPSTQVALSGAAGVGDVGTVTTANDVIVALSGVAGAGAVGDVVAVTASDAVANTPGFLEHSYKRWLSAKKREEQEKCLEEIALQRAIEVAQTARDSSRKTIREETRRLQQDIADTRMKVNQTLQKVLKAQFEAALVAQINQQLAEEQEEEEFIVGLIAHLY